MKKLLTILIIIAITLIAALITPWLIKDPGYLYLRLGAYEVEMRFIVALAIVLSLIVLFWLVVYLMRLPKKTMQHLTLNRSRKSFAKGLLALSEGKWKQAEKWLIASTKNSLSAELGYMAAARAAIAQNNIEQAFIYLDEAESITDNPLTVDLTRSELWINTGSTQNAINLLKRILKSYPNNPKALHLMAKASQESGQWQLLRETLPKVSKLQILSEDKVNTLMQHSIDQQLKFADSQQHLQATWDSLSKDQKSEFNNIHAYAQTGIALNMHEQVATITENALNKEFANPLLEIWGNLSIDSQQKIKTAEKWLKKNSSNAILLQILGKLCLQNKLWGKAQTYLQQSLEIQVQPETFKLLAQYFDEIGEPDNALEAYRQAEKNGKSLIMIENQHVESDNPQV